VAHAVIDGQIAGERPGHSIAERGEDAVLAPDAIAETYYRLHLQPPSAWTLELDLRPYVEKFLDGSLDRNAGVDIQHDHAQHSHF